MLREVVLSRAQLSILGIKTYGLSTNKCESIILLPKNRIA